MAITIPSIVDIYNKIKSSVFSYTKGQLEIDKDPFAQSFAKAQSDMTFDIYNTIQDANTQTFSQSATDLSFLKAIAFDKTRNEIQLKEATQAKGNVIVTASSSIDIPAGTLFITSDSELYKVLVTKTCVNQSFLITSIQRVGGFAICTLQNHNLPTNFSITIAGVDQTAFNGLQEIQVIDKDTFKYPNAGIDEVATGIITGNYFGAKLEVESINGSLSTNKTFTDNIDIASNINIDDSYITFNGITGGTDTESSQSFQKRLVEYLKNPENKGNLLQHRSYIKQNTDANYVFFFQEEDELFIYLYGVVSKLDSNFSFTNFSVNELDDIKNKFINDNQLLLGVDALNLIITNPTFVNIDINIVDLSPNTIDMRNAVDKILKEYIALLPINFYLSVGKTELSQDEIRTIIKSARDSQGNTPNIASVTVTGTVNLDEDIKKPILGAVTYA